MEQAMKYTLVSFGKTKEQMVEFLKRKKVNESLEDFANKFYLYALDLRKWNNNGEHAESKGLKRNVWHKVRENDKYIFYELYDNKKNTWYDRIAK
jgi:hypothetical protein